MLLANCFFCSKLSSPLSSNWAWVGTLSSSSFTGCVVIITQQSLSWLPLQIWWIRNDFPQLYSSYPSKMSSTFSWLWRTYSYKLSTAFGLSADNSSAVFNTAQTSGQSQTSRNLMNSKRENFLRISFLPFAKSTATLWVKVGFPIPGLPTLEFVYGWDDLRHLQILHCCLPAFFSFSRQVSCV